MVLDWWYMRKVILVGLFLAAKAMAQQSVADNDVALRRPDPAWRPYARLQSWAAYDAIPLRDFSGTWEHNYAPQAATNRFLQRHRADMGVEKDGWAVGVEYRWEGTIDAGREAMDLYRLYKLKAQLERARDFHVDAKLKSWSAGGVRVGRTYVLHDADGNSPLLMLSGALYENLRNRDSDVAGIVAYTPGDGYGFNARYQDTNTRYRYPFMAERSRPSSGASISLAVQWPLSDQWTANLALNDLWSRLRWSNLPSMYKTINSDVSGIDQDGYVNYRPQLSGKNSQIDKIGTIGVSSAFSLNYRLENWVWSGRLDRLDGIVIPTASAGYRSAWGVFSTSYESRFNTVGLGYERAPFSLHLRANRWPVSGAGAAALNAGMHVTF